LKLARNSSGRERVKGDREDCRVDDLVAGLPVKEMEKAGEEAVECRMSG
jgi:hypothetical protein